MNFGSCRCPCPRPCPRPTVSAFSTCPGHAGQVVVAHNYKTYNDIYSILGFTECKLKVRTEQLLFGIQELERSFQPLYSPEDTMTVFYDTLWIIRWVFFNYGEVTTCSQARRNCIPPNQVIYNSDSSISKQLSHAFRILIT